LRFAVFRQSSPSLVLKECGRLLWSVTPSAIKICGLPNTSPCLIAEPFLFPLSGSRLHRPHRLGSPVILMTRLKSYTSTCKLISVAMRGSAREVEPPAHELGGLSLLDDLFNRLLAKYVSLQRICRHRNGIEKEDLVALPMKPESGRRCCAGPRTASGRVLPNAAI
jgi:hypothetical protein